MFFNVDNEMCNSSPGFFFNDNSGSDVGNETIVGEAVGGGEDDGMPHLSSMVEFRFGENGERVCDGGDEASICV